MRSSEGRDRGWRRWLAAGMTMAALLSGCQRAPAPTPAALPPLAIQRDAAHAAEATIGVAGGRLEATAADGTRFVLEVPPGALPGDTRIRAVPATLGGVAAPTHTVMFEPSGLQFLDWARLQVLPAKPVPQERQFLFGISDDGRSVVAAFFDPSAKTPTALLEHFSGYGLANATDPQRAEMLQRQATDAAARLDARFAQAVGAARKDALLGTDGSSVLRDATDAYTESYTRDVIAPLLEAARGSCSAGERATQEILGLERRRQLAGGGEADPTGGLLTMLDSAPLKGGEAKCEQEAIAACKAAKDPTPLIRFWLGRARQRALLGAPEDGSPLESLKAARKICIGAQAWEIHGDVPSKPSGMTLDGNACSLEEPFRVQTNGGLIGTLVFTPESAEAGRWSYRGVVGNTPELPVDGSGRYTAREADDGGSGEIQVPEFRLTIHIPVLGDRTNSAPLSLRLTPTSPCD